jgi:hypothetical protein
MRNEACGISRPSGYAGPLGPPAIPPALAAWLEKHRIAGAVFQAVESVAPLLPERNFQCEGGSYPCLSLMRLVTYGYATGLYDSNSIVAAITSDAILRDMCAGMRPTAEAVRWFRWAYSELVMRALTEVLAAVQNEPGEPTNASPEGAGFRAGLGLPRIHSACSSRAPLLD